MKNFLLFCYFAICYFNAFGQRSKNGDFTASTTNTIVNAYTVVTADIPVNSTSITVQDATLSNSVLTTPLAPGDLVLIIQMQGASMSIDVTPTADWGGQYTTPNGHLLDWKTNQEKWGAITNYNQAGKFEYAQVAQVIGNTIVFSCGLLNSYSITGKTQVIRVPRFSSVTVQANSSITCINWDGIVGGVLAMEIEQNLNLPATTSLLTATSKGFRGGQSNDNQTDGSSSDSDPLNVGFLGSSSNTKAAEKGEGIGGFRDEYIALFSLYGKGAPANGGGGGNNHNAGGGGGSNVGTGTYLGFGVPDPAYTNFWNLELTPIGGQVSAGGGRGGYTYSTSNQNEGVVGPNNNLWSGDKRRNDGGLGGHPLTYDPTRIFLGGGGGAGDQNFTTAPNQVGVGGNGGGIILLDVYGSITGVGLIESNGANGGSSNPTNITNPSPTQKVGNDGAGGAGAGGSIRISNNNPIPSTIQILANGGNGGNQAFYAGAFASNPTMEADGPGGGGTGGLISISNGTPQIQVQGGNGGTTNSTHVTNFPFNGATGGAAGVSNSEVNFYDLQAEGANLCGGSSQSVTLNATIVGTLPAGSGIYWYTEPFAGNPIVTGTSYTTPVISSSTTYYVGVCPGNFRIPVTVVFGENPIISGSPTITPETCLINDGSITGLTVSGGSAPYTYSWNGSSTPSPDLTSIPGGDYTLTVTGADGCSANSAVFTVPGSGAPSVNTSNIVITPAGCNGSLGSITGITQSGGVDFQWNGQPSAGVDLLNAPAGSYTLVVSDNSNCSTTVGPFVISSPEGPSVSSVNAIINNATCGDPNGSISGLVAIGTGLTFSWSNTTQTTLELSNLTPGNYTLTVTDNQGCSMSAGPFTVGNLAGPTIDVSQLQITNATCGSNDGSITGIQVTGGTAPLIPLWSNNITTYNLTNIASGSYTLTVVDANGCQVVSGPHVVNAQNGPQIDVTNVQITEETCNGNDAALIGLVYTGNNLTYSWNGVSGGPTLIDVTAGSYTVVVTDDNGCTATAGPFVIDGATPLVVNNTILNVIQPSCGLNNGAIFGLTVSGDGPFEYAWTSTTQTTLELSNLAPGSYTLTVTGANNCQQTFGPISLNPSSNPTANFTYAPTLVEVDIPIQFTDASSSDVIAWAWDIAGNPFSDENPTFTFTEEGIYVVTLTVTNAEGCTNQTQQTVVILSDMIIPNVITLNSDNINDVFEIKSLPENTSLQVFNRWGNLIYSTSNYLNDWKGTDSSGSKVSAGVYSYLIKNPKGEEFHGFIHVVY